MTLLCSSCHGLLRIASYAICSEPKVQRTSHLRQGRLEALVQGLRDGVVFCIQDVLKSCCELVPNSLQPV